MVINLSIHTRGLSKQYLNAFMFLKTSCKLKFGFWLVNLLLLMLLTFGPYVLCKGQQRPQYTQYMFNGFLLNPAISGIESYMDLKAGYRKQWEGLRDAPATTYLSFHSPIGHKASFENPNSFSGQGNNPMSRSFVQQYAAVEPHHGVGIHLVSDKAGVFQRTDINATYAYHLGLAPKVNLSVGVAAGIAQININRDAMLTEVENDPAILRIERRQINPVLATGVWLYGANFFAGVSVDQIFSPIIKASSTTPNAQAMSIPHYYITAGSKLLIAEEMALLPSFMITKVQSSTFVDLNTKVAFRNKLYIGGSYRHKDSFSALAGFNINHLFNLSYSCDFSVSRLQKVSNGSHEIVLGLLLNNRYKVICPQNQF